MKFYVSLVKLICYSVTTESALRPPFVCQLDFSIERKFSLSYFQVVVTDAFLTPETTKNNCLSKLHCEINGNI